MFHMSAETSLKTLNEFTTFTASKTMLQSIETGGKTNSCVCVFVCVLIALVLSLTSRHLNPLWHCAGVSPEHRLFLRTFSGKGPSGRGTQETEEKWQVVGSWEPACGLCFGNVGPWRSDVQVIAKGEQHLASMSTLGRLGRIQRRPPHTFLNLT